MLRSKSLQSRFSEDQNGTIAVMFAGALLAICVFIGLAFDGSRSMMAKFKVASALDAAAVAATAALQHGNPTDAELNLIAADYFRTNAERDSSVGESNDGFKMKIDRVNFTVTLSAITHVPTTFGRLANIDNLSFTTVSQATFKVNDIELGLVLDTTGSMSNTSNSGTGKSKIEELKIAAGEMFDLLLPDTGNLGDVKIGIAPFSASVNAGAYASAAANNTSTDNCVLERTGANASTDAEPSGFDGYFNVAHVLPGPKGTYLRAADTDPTEGLGDPQDNNQAYACPSDPVLPLTNDKAALKTEVNNFQPNFWTAGHLGTAWGWYLVSPNWGNVWPTAPKPYHTKNLVKAIVVMTDGIYNTAYNNGISAADQAMKICDNAKAEGVHVYTIGFTSPKAAEATLIACASIDQRSGKPNYYHAESQDELTAAFKDIATKLGSLRIDR